LYSNCLVAIPFRKFFYQLLGSRIGKGVVTIAGKLLDPPLISLGDNVIIGEESILMAHAHASTPSPVLVLGGIEIKNGALIGVRSIIMPGVIVGENSMVNAMSLVPMNTKIPPNQIWGGNPAIKIADMSNP
jgi:acetyltransferase-like isoleucine patch superfamily enzyme